MTEDHAGEHEEQCDSRVDMVAFAGKQALRTA